MKPYKPAQIKFLKQNAPAEAKDNLLHTFPKENTILKTKGEKISKINKVWTALFICLGIVISAQLIVSNALAVKGQQLASLEKQASQITRENNDLYQELSAKMSLNTIAQQADNLGLVQADSIEYVTINQYSAASAQ